MGRRAVRRAERGRCRLALGPPPSLPPPPPCCSAQRVGVVRRRLLLRLPLPLRPAAAAGARQPGGGALQPPRNAHAGEGRSCLPALPNGTGPTHLHPQPLLPLLPAAGGWAHRQRGGRDAAALAGRVTRGGSADAGAEVRLRRLPSTFSTQSPFPHPTPLPLPLMGWGGGGGGACGRVVS